VNVGDAELDIELATGRDRMLDGLLEARPVVGRQSCEERRFGPPGIARGIPEQRREIRRQCERRVIGRPLPQADPACEQSRLRQPAGGPGKPLWRIGWSAGGVVRHPGDAVAIYDRSLRRPTGEPPSAFPAPLRYPRRTRTRIWRASMVADVRRDLSAKHVIRPAEVGEDDRQQEQRADQQEHLRRRHRRCVP